MQFIELTGKTLLDVVNEGEVDFKQLHDAGIELRCENQWTLVGGLIGNFEERLKRMTGLDWV